MRTFIVNRILVCVLLASVLPGCRVSPSKKSDDMFTPLIPSQSRHATDGNSKNATAKELPTEESVRVCLATAATLAQKGQDREAIALYEKARQLDPRRTDVARRLAVLYDRQDDLQKALKEYEKALEADPKNAHLHNDIGYCFYCRGRWADAEKYLREAVKLDPKLNHAWNNLGMTLAQDNRHEESFKAFSKSVGPAQAWSNIGFILMAQGRKDEAREAYRRALEIDPDLKKSRDAMAYIDNPTPRTPPGTRPALAKNGRPATTPPARRPAPPTSVAREGLVEFDEEPVARSSYGREGMEESEGADRR